MIQTIVSNARVPEYGQATISFPIREEDYPSVVNVLQRMGLGNPLERDCRVDEVIGDWPILKRLEKVAINLDEMDYLAKRLDSFDTQEKAKFQAAAVKYGLFDMRYLIDLTFCCQETTVITDFSDLEKFCLQTEERRSGDGGRNEKPLCNDPRGPPCEGPCAAGGIRQKPRSVYDLADHTIL